jgi:hypothetical protein
MGFSRAGCRSGQHPKTMPTRTKFLKVLTNKPFMAIKEMEEFVADHGKTIETTYFFYTTCQRCAKRYGKNYVVAIAKV